MALDLESICTDGDLTSRAGEKRVNQALSSASERTALRNQALRDVVSALAGRSPPVYETDLSDPTELHDAVKYRTLQMIFQNSMTSADALHGQLAVSFEREYSAAIKRTYTVSSGVDSPAGGSFSLERR